MFTFSPSLFLCFSLPLVILAVKNNSSAWPEQNDRFLLMTVGPSQCYYHKPSRYNWSVSVVCIKRYKSTAVRPVAAGCCCFKCQLDVIPLLAAGFDGRLTPRPSIQSAGVFRLTPQHAATRTVSRHFHFHWGFIYRAVNVWLYGECFFFLLK